MAAHGSREQLEHVAARHPGLQIRGIAKGFEIQLLDRLMEKNSDVATTGQIDIFCARIDRVDTGFEIVGLRRLKRSIRFDDQALMLCAQIGEFAVAGDGLRRRFEPIA